MRLLGTGRITVPPHRHPNLPVVEWGMEIHRPRNVRTMGVAIDRQRLSAALEKTRRDLLAERTHAGHWIGELSGSPVATATAISALIIAEQYGSPEQHGRTADRLFDASQIFQSDLSELIVQSLHWLACHQNEDGGWGDTDKSRSNLAATVLVNAAFHLTGVPAKYSGLLERAEKYIRQEGGIAALKRHFGKDKTLAAPILANCALAGLISWREVPPLPFELAALPRSWHSKAQLPVASHGLPLLIAVGQARLHHSPTWNPIATWARRFARLRTLKMIEHAQPENGGFMEAVPLTSFVVMNLASMGLAEHRVVRRGVEFLLTALRSDGSWSIDTNLAVRNTSLALDALSGRPVRQESSESARLSAGVQWLLRCQHTKVHPYNGAAPGGWAWTDREGGLPIAEDTSAVLLALARCREGVEPHLQRQIDAAARHGLRWLLNLHNRDGGWPTFARGWEYLPADRSCSDVTAQALRAVARCKDCFFEPTSAKGLYSQIHAAIPRGIEYLQNEQREDGSWVPLWFGNQENPNGENPVIGTSRVLIALADLGYGASEMAQRAGQWLCRMQHASGGWGPIVDTTRTPQRGQRQAQTKVGQSPYDPFTSGPSIEETSLATTALVRLGGASGEYHHAVEQGLAWLVDAVDNDRHQEPAPIGFYFAKLWYYERLFPRIYAAQALHVATTNQSLERIPSHFYLSPLQTTSS